MSFSEKLVDGLAVSILFLGFVTGVIAKPMNKSPHERTLTAHSSGGTLAAKPGCAPRGPALLRERGGKRADPAFPLIRLYLPSSGSR